MPQITTFLTYANQAEEAAKLYISAFENGRILDVSRAGKGGPLPEGTAFSVTFELFGQTFYAMNGGPSFSFSQGISLFVSCETQAEIDRYWTKLTENGGKEVQCGWLVDKFGVSWQIVPKILKDLIGDKDPAKAGRAMQAMMGMKKLDITALKRAHEGA
ncbi:3-demethylubiquinone-9 3-methyltransferase [Labilithrix luteola]|uniref:3-demethylubiquinone-9 3-methyltransferase n=1 Tax=Labilithrix luteola TaxID=1391654 RepID=A0A0K1Q6Y6_9BACT|nr:VOC family protein [Labilithrix luteola]AKV01596.1 3-demethylubiquinone-9 3-methyltransferase [Labilithrix luteola]